MVILYHIKRAIAFLLSLTTFPLTCISCGKQCYGIVLCKHCQNDIRSYAPVQNRCKSCGVILVSEKDICLECREGDDLSSKQKILANFESVFPIHHYTLWRKELLFAWKMANNRSLSPLFAEIIYSVLQTYYEGIPVIPVPPREGKIKKRGWDQVDELCTFLRKYYDIRVYSVLQRLSKDEQKKRSRQERVANLEKKYIVKDTSIQLPREVVLIDDIMTTGATLESCAKALKNVNVEQIHAVTLFYV